MKLIGSLTSPYVRKVRIVMAEKKLEYQFVTQDVWAKGSLINNFNPLAERRPSEDRKADHDALQSTLPRAGRL